jgi:hypothetical protein
VSDAVKRLSGPASPLVAPRNAHLWIAGYPSAAAPLLGEAGAVLSQVRSFALSMNVGRQLTLAGSLDAASPEVASLLLGAFQSWQSQQGKGVSPAVKTLQSGTVLSFSTVVTEKQMRDALAMRSGLQMPAALAGPAPANAPGNQAPVPSKPAAVRIQGLEQDTVELRFGGKVQ